MIQNEKTTVRIEIVFNVYCLLRSIIFYYLKTNSKWRWKCQPNKKSESIVTTPRGDTAFFVPDLKPMNT